MNCDKCGRTHDPAKCVGHRRDDNGILVQCKSYPMRGGTVCRKHGGKAPQTQAKAAARLVEVKLRADAASDLKRLGVTIGVEDGEAIRAMRDEAAGNVVAYRHLIHSLKLEVTGMIYDPTQERWVAPLEAGVAVQTYHQSGIATGEAKPHVLVAMYNEERDRLAKLDEVCVKLNLATRSVAVDELQVQIMGRAFLAALSATEWQLSREQQEVGRRVVATMMRQLEQST